MSEKNQKIIQIAADVFNVPASTITPDSSPQTIETWDSVQHLNLVLALEAELGIQLAPEDIERMRTIGDVIALVGEKTNN